MDNPFKKIQQPPKEAPQELKKKIMDDVAAFELFRQVSGLFTNNYGHVVESFFKKRTNENKQTK